MSTPKDSIITLPNKHLRQASRKVKAITPRIKSLVAQMESATLDWEASRAHEVGVALAAVQIDKLSRVVIIRHDFDNKADTSFDVFINPTITKTEGKIVEDFEGCLSIRDVYGRVPRADKVHVKALDINGKSIKLIAEGFLARVFQHEIDHTNGIVFIDHIKDKPEAFFRLADDGKLEQLDYDRDIKGNLDLYDS